MIIKRIVTTGTVRVTVKTVRVPITYTPPRIICGPRIISVQTTTRRIGN